MKMKQNKPILKEYTIINIQDFKKPKAAVTKWKKKVNIMK
jgi:hypothetical protein